MAIVDAYERLIDVKTFWFRGVTARRFPRRRARSIIGMRVHEMLKYAYHHGVSALTLENPEVLGKLKLLWARNGERRNRNYNWKIATFRSEITEMIALKAPLYSIEVRYVSPRGTSSSEEHDKIMRRFGLDRHTASAYLIALRGIERHSLTQKATD